MKRTKGIIILVLLLALLASPVAILASDISASRYYGQIIISNNSTATTNVAVNCTISTQALIDGGYLNASANNCAVRGSAGADLPFQPSANASYPWCIWVPSIGTNASTADIFYTAESTGGELRYFPATSGMSTIDSKSLEPGANFTVEQSGWWDTAYSVNKTSVYKEDAFRTYISATGNITSEIGGETKKQYQETVAQQQAVWGVNWRAQTFTANSTYLLSSISFQGYRVLTPGMLTVQLRETAGNLPTLVILASGESDGDTLTENVAGAWRDDVALSPSFLIQNGSTYSVVIGAPDGNAANNLQWRHDNANTFPAGQGASSADSGETWGAQAAFDYAFRTVGGWVVSAESDSGEYRITTTANVTHMWIEKDGVQQDIIALGGAFAKDNANDWTFLRNNVMPYMEYQTISVNSTQVQYIDWEYDDTTFSDNSTFGNDATPTFRTGTSDPDVTATLTSFLPVAEAKAPAYVLAEAPAFIDAARLTSDVVGGTGEFTTTPPVAPAGAPAGSTGFPLAGVITAVANATGTPAQLPLLTLAAFIILAISLSISAIMSKHGSGSLIVKVIAISAMMGVFIGMGNFGMQFWMLFVFLVIAIALMMGSRQTNW